MRQIQKQNEYGLSRKVADLKSFNC